MPVFSSSIMLELGLCDILSFSFVSISHSQKVAQDLGILSMFRDEKGEKRGRISILKAEKPGNDYWAFLDPAMEGNKKVGGNSSEVASQLASLCAIFDTYSKWGTRLCIYVDTRNTRDNVLEFQRFRGSKTVEYAYLYSHFLLVSIWVLWEAEVKLELDLLGEMPVKDKEKRSRSRLTGPSHYDVDLTPVKGRRKEEGTGREMFGLQCGFEKGLARPVKCSQVCVVHWKNHALGRMS